jgi:hypothetical protein
VVTTVSVVVYGWVAEEIGAGGVDDGDDVVGIGERVDTVAVIVELSEVAVVVDGTGVSVAMVTIELGGAEEGGGAELFGVTVVDMVPVTVL